MAASSRGLKLKDFLLKLGRELTNKEFDSLKFLMENEIERGVLEDDIGDNKTKLWTELENRGLIAENDLQYLRDKLSTLERIDLVNMIDEFLGVTVTKRNEKTLAEPVPVQFPSRDPVPESPPEENPESPPEVNILIEKRKEAFNYLCEVLGPQDWKDLARRLIKNCRESYLDSIVDEERKNKERVRKMLYLWIQRDNPELEDQGKMIVDALRACKKNRLASEVEEIYKLETAL